MDNVTDIVTDWLNGLCTAEEAMRQITLLVTSDPLPADEQNKTSGRD